MENNCEILFLGTCACDFSPLLKTDFKDKFDKDARRASVMLIDDRFMVDCGVHALDSMRIAEKKTEKITDIFITHIHYDHFTAGNIAKIAENREIPLRLWVREDAVFDEIDGVEVIRMKLYERYEVSDNVYVTGIIANHNEESTPQHFVFENKGKKIFYGCDGGWFIAKSFNALRKGEFDLFVLDCTWGERVENPLMGVHNSIPMIKLMMPTLRMEKIVTDKTKVYISHLAPMFHRKPHDEICESLQEVGVLVAYDGLTELI